MSSLMRRAAIPGLVLAGVLAGGNMAQAQFAFGMTRYGLNNNNPYIAQRQFYSNMLAGRLAIASGQQVPAALPYLAQMYNPYAAAPLNPYAGGGYNPAIVAPAYNPYGGYGANPYSPIGGGYSGAGYGSNPYSPAGGVDPYNSNPYTTSAALAGAGYGAYANPAIGPGFTLMGGADVMRAYGKVINDQERARMAREQYYQAKLDTKKKAFDLDMYIKANTPTFTEVQDKINKQVLKRIQGSANPAEIADGRSLNFLLDDAEKYRVKDKVEDIALPSDVLAHLNVKPAGLDSQSLGLLRDGGKLNWPSALVDMLTPESRSEISARAGALAENAAKGREPDRNALKDLRTQIEQAQAQLVRKANDYNTGDYMEAKRFLADLDSARRAIERGSASAQVKYQEMVATGKIHNVNTLAKAMLDNGWRFGAALPSDEGAYRALHSALVAYDIAVNQQVAQAEN